ncbi:carboxypeptidase-like regulatory domain-containing protein [Rufibacter ruber]|uniref:carboxypeptidase-like regulatory domain-containing protein n=1 Tax=Rufibacter ruber TaxID=1783499 RepID=UPI00082E6EA5|nr:carboxypeptidase-like regulatory domain-containing protein [Rufibacter ruber]
MRRLLPLLLCLLLLGHWVTAQIKGAVTDKTTGKPVTYANIWVENENQGATSTEEGTFSFADSSAVGKTLVVSSLGYERGRFPISALRMKVQLQPSAIALQEVVVKKSKRRNKLVVNSFKRSKVSHSYGTIGGPWIVANHLAYNPIFEATPFLEEIAFTVSSDINNAKYQIRIFKVEGNGEPGKDLLTTPLIGYAQKAGINLYN